MTKKELDLIEDAVNDSCTCGGGGPGDGCPACEVWHRIVRYVPGVQEVRFGTSGPLFDAAHRAVEELRP